MAADVLERIERRLLCTDGAPPRAALTMLAGWTAGVLASAIAVGVLRDGVLLRGLRRVLHHPDGWFADADVDGTRAVVALGHPWAVRRDVETVGDRSALEAATVAEVQEACKPIIDGLAARSGRGVAGLWAQVADSIAHASSALMDAEPLVTPGAAIAAVERLLAAPGAPWRHSPTLWAAEARGGPTLVQHRGSCCLYYRCDPSARTNPAADEPIDAEYLERFPESGPNYYCGGCLFRDRSDVEARAVFHIERERRAASSSRPPAH